MTPCGESDPESGVQGHAGTFFEDFKINFLNFIRDPAVQNSGSVDAIA
jgi:hypothetical protein